MRALRVRFTAQDNEIYINYHLTNYELKIIIMLNNVFSQNGA